MVGTTKGARLFGHRDGLVVDQVDVLQAAHAGPVKSAERARAIIARSTTHRFRPHITGGLRLKHGVGRSALGR
jgi:hypothetical protein